MINTHGLQIRANRVYTMMKLLDIISKLTNKGSPDTGTHGDDRTLDGDIPNGK